MNRLLTLALVGLVVGASAGYVRVSYAEQQAPSAMAPAPMAISSAAHQAEPAQHETSRGGVTSRLNVYDVLATLIYAFIGLIVFLIGYKAYDWITPFDLRKELEIDQNTSLGIVVGSIIIGLSIIIAAAIMSP